MEEVLISVIVPIYKVENYLHRCIDSILCQTYEQIEIILVDDGSPDQCGNICEEYRKIDSRIRVFHKNNGGLSDARNYGVERANGDFITFIDSDDYIAKDYIEYLYKLIKKNNADISSCCMVQTEFDSVEYPINELIPEEQVLFGKEACEHLLSDLYMVLVTACGKLYSSKIVKKYPFPVGKKHEDEATTCKYYYESKKVVIGNRCLYAYFKNANSITHTKGMEFNFDAEWALEHRAKFFEAKNEKKLAEAAWCKVWEYYVQDSEIYQGRCDRKIKNFTHNKMLSKNVKFEVKLYNISPRMFKAYKSLRRLVKIVMTKNMRRG